jgi:hypothetical protein
LHVGAGDKIINNSGLHSFLRHRTKHTVLRGFLDYCKVPKSLLPVMVVLVVSDGVVVVVVAAAAAAAVAVVVRGCTQKFPD